MVAYSLSASTLHGWSLPAYSAMWTIRVPDATTETDLSPDGRWLLVTLTNGKSLVYDTSLKPPKLHRTLIGTTSSGQGFSAGGSLVIRAASPRTIFAHDLRTGRQRWSVEGERMVMSRDGQVAAVVAKHQVVFLDALTGIPIGKPWSPKGNGRKRPPDILAFALQSAGKFIAFVAHEQRCVLVNHAGMELPIGCFTPAELRSHSLAISSRGALAVFFVKSALVVDIHRMKKLGSIVSTIHFKGPIRVEAALLGPKSIVVSDYEPHYLTVFRLDPVR